MLKEVLGELTFAEILKLVEDKNNTHND